MIKRIITSVMLPSMLLLAIFTAHGAEYSQQSDSAQIVNMNEITVTSTTEITSLVNNAVYRITPYTLTNYALHVDGYDYNMTNINIAQWNASTYHKFRAIQNTNGSWCIAAMMSSNGYNKVIDVNSTAAQPPVSGRNVHLYDPIDEVSNQWTIVYFGALNAFCVRLTSNTDLVLTYDTSSFNVNVTSYEGSGIQFWKFTEVSESLSLLPSDGVEISYNDALKLSTDLTLEANSAGESQDFIIEGTDNGSILIKAAESGATLGLKTEGSSYSLDSTAENNEWMIEKVNGGYKISNKNFPNVSLRASGENEEAAVSASTIDNNNIWQINALCDKTEYLKDVEGFLTDAVK